MSNTNANSNGTDNTVDYSQLINGILADVSETSKDNDNSSSDEPMISCHQNSTNSGDDSSLHLFTNSSVGYNVTNGDLNATEVQHINSDINAELTPNGDEEHSNDASNLSNDDNEENDEYDDESSTLIEASVISNDEQLVNKSAQPLPVIDTLEPLTHSDTDSTQLPDTVTVLDGPNGAKVYLVGTAHFSKKSQEDVAITIRQTRPNIVVLELCESRLSILSLDERTIMEESKSMGIAKMRRNIQEYGLVQGVMYMLLLSLSAHLTKELGMAPGGEFRRAFHEANKIHGCVVHLGDRPVHITLRRAISALSVWQKFKLAFGILFNNESITKEEVEKCKQRDLLEEMLAEMTGEFPALSNVFVHERDIYLAYSLWLAATPFPNMRSPAGIDASTVVGVVGIGHVPGIVKKWGTVTDEDIPPLLRLPEPSLTSIIIRKSVKYTVIGLAIWGCYKLILPTSINNALSHASIKTVNWFQRSIVTTS